LPYKFYRSSVICVIAVICIDNVTTDLIKLRGNKKCMSTIQLRVDDKLKDEAKKVYEESGLDMSSAIKLFLQQSVNQKGIPFPILTELPESEHSDRIIKGAKEALDSDLEDYVDIR